MGIYHAFINKLAGIKCYRRVVKRRDAALWGVGIPYQQIYISFGAYVSRVTLKYASHVLFETIESSKIL